MPANSTRPISPMAASSTSTIAKGRIVQHRHQRGDARRRRDRRADAQEPPADGRHRPAPTRTTSRRKRVRRSVRSTTTRSCSADSRSRWCWPRIRRPRATRPRWCAWNTKRRRTSPTCMRSATKPIVRSSTPPTSRAATPTKALAAAAVRHEARILHSDRASQPDGIVRLHRDRGTATASSRSTTRPRACRTCSAISAACSR